MNIRKRLKAIETSLTPKQQVLLWLEEVQQLTIPAFQEMLITTPIEEDPYVRVPEMAARRVRASQDKTPCIRLWQSRHKVMRFSSTSRPCRLLNWR